MVTIGVHTPKHYLDIEYYLACRKSSVSLAPYVEQHFLTDDEEQRYSRNRNKYCIKRYHIYSQSSHSGCHSYTASKYTPDSSISVQSLQTGFSIHVHHSLSNSMRIRPHNFLDGDSGPFLLINSKDSRANTLITTELPRWQLSHELFTLISTSLYLTTD